MAKADQPHHFTNASNAWAAAGALEPTSALSRSQREPITTWSRPATRGLRRPIQGAAARKRLLTTRHPDWARRGGAGRGLIGRAGEEAVDTAMREAPDISGVWSTRSLLGVGLLGEVDNSAFYVDTSGPNPTVVTLVVEVKKHAVVELPRRPGGASLPGQGRPPPTRAPRGAHPAGLHRPTMPLHALTAGRAARFPPTWVRNQFVLADSDLPQSTLDEVAADLGYGDLRVGNTRPTVTGASSPPPSRPEPWPTPSAGVLTTSSTSRAIWSSNGLKTPINSRGPTPERTIAGTSLRRSGSTPDQDRVSRHGIPIDSAL